MNIENYSIRMSELEYRFTRYKKYLEIYNNTRTLFNKNCMLRARYQFRAEFIIHQIINE